MVTRRIVYTKQAQKDAKKLKKANLKDKALKILGILENDPFLPIPPFEKLAGDLSGAYSRRINIHHRIVYQVLKKIRTVKVIRMWTYYD